MDLGFMECGRVYAFHIRNEDELDAFSDAEQDIYDSLMYTDGMHLKDAPPERSDIRKWNLDRWNGAAHNRHYTGSIYLILRKLSEEKIEVGWECHREWLESSGYEILEWSDYSECEAFTIPDLADFLE